MNSIVEEKNKNAFGLRTDKNLSTMDAGCIGGGKNTLRRFIEGGFKPQTFPTIASHIGGKKPT